MDGVFWIVVWTVYLSGLRGYYGPRDSGGRTRPAKYQDKWIRGSGGVAVVRWRGLEYRARLRQGSAGRAA